LSRHPLQISDLQFNTKFSNSYALISGKNSNHFRKIIRKLECYLGAGPIGPNKHWEYPWVLANLRLEKGMKILDAGCGKSPLQFLLFDVGCKVYGIDLFENVRWHGIDRNLSRRFGCKIEYKRESLDSMSYPDNFFDRVCCVSVIEHCRAENVENDKLAPQTEDDRSFQRKIIVEMMRVLKPGGLLVFTVDYNIPRDNCLSDSNVNVSNLLTSKQAKMYGTRCEDLFPGEKDFNYQQLIQNSNIDIVNYSDTLQTSIGITLHKNE
jgi:SAM-dependent methyltransferase